MHLLLLGQAGKATFPLPSSWTHLILLLDAAAQHLLKSLQVRGRVIIPFILPGGPLLGLSSRLDDGSQQALRLCCLPGCKLLAACSLLRLAHCSICCPSLGAICTQMSQTDLQLEHDRLERL